MHTGTVEIKITGGSAPPIPSDQDAQSSAADILDSMPFPVAVSRINDGTIYYANNALDELFEFAPGKMLGMRASELYADPDDRLRFRELLVRDGRVKDFETCFKSATGRLFWALMSANPLNYLGQKSWVVGFNDITDRKRAAAALLEAKERAEKAFLELGETQESLIQAEKMASLAGLVAGVAHEINTPIGIALTAASVLEDSSRMVGAKYEGNQLKASELKKFITGASESTRLILSNLHRSAELIQGFKQVAVDQTSEARRKFNIKEYVDEVILSLRPRLKLTSHTIDIGCPDDLVMDSFPGAFAQVVTNLVMNSLIHAFDQEKTGHMTMDIVRHGNIVDVRYRDDGKGISPENLKRVFEPFFTTRRGKGGSGLGLHIVYNIVTQTLQGTIACESVLEAGTEFVLRLPIEIPNPSNQGGPHL